MKIKTIREAAAAVNKLRHAFDPNQKVNGHLLPCHVRQYIEESVKLDGPAWAAKVADGAPLGVITLSYEIADSIKILEKFMAEIDDAEVRVS